MVSMLDVPLPVLELVGQNLQRLVDHLPAAVAVVFNADMTVPVGGSVQLALGGQRAQILI